MKIGFGEDRVEIIDENGVVTVEHYKSRDELNAILARFGLEGSLDGVEAKDVRSIVPAPFRRWIRKIFGES